MAEEEQPKKKPAPRNKIIVHGIGETDEEKKAAAAMSSGPNRTATGCVAATLAGILGLGGGGVAMYYAYTNAHRAGQKQEEVIDDNIRKIDPPSATDRLKMQKEKDKDEKAK